MRLLILAWTNQPLDSVKVAYDEFKLQRHIVVCVDNTKLWETFTIFKPEIILIWNRHQDVDTIQRLRKEHSGYLILFNWDDPYSIRHNEIGNPLLYAKYLDCVFSSCRSTKQKYLDAGVKKWIYLLPFYSEKWHYPKRLLEYDADVAFVCTNLYKEEESKYPGQLISRYELVKALDQDPNINLALYGPASIGKEFPTSYRGWINYTDNHKVFTNAKIALSLHVENGDGYSNERCITILASGGLLLVDPIKGCRDVFGSGCVVIQSYKIDEIINQIKNILANYIQYKEIRKAGIQIVKKYHVSNWVRTIIQHLS